MEEIIGLPMQPPINFKKFLLEYKQMFKRPFTLPNRNVDLKKILHLDDTKFQNLEEKCSIENLAHEDDARVAEFIPGFSENKRTALNPPTNDITLKSYAYAKKYREQGQNPYKRTPEIYFNFGESQGPCFSGSSPLLPEQELKIYIRVYRPARVTHAGRTIERPVFSEEFECLGSNVLTDLRDKISCICNNCHFYDVSENPDIPLPTKIVDPGYFFITDTFYNDKRNPQNPDYSETIRNWAKKAKGLSDLNFKVASMEDTRMIDLTVSLGFPQLYQHHGNCEHVFVFSQLEVIVNPCKQLMDIDKYPHSKSTNRFKGRVCHICSKVNFLFVVEGSNRLLNDPSYLCRNCFKSFFYIDGKKVGEFRAYRLNDDAISVLNNEEENSDEGGEAGDMNALLNDSDENDFVTIVVKEEPSRIEE
ncbi:proximal sequence element A Pbp49 [Haematobia irritans]|uniref:proximal sequence element A Pbp49 n=1 Tax=Haematobia irritans TaxID=7368 RepID=UPI003F506F78